VAGGPDYRHHWHEPAFWRWYWRERVPIGGKILVVLAGVALLAGGGYAAESALPAQAASSDKGSGVLTIVRTYTVRGPVHVKEHVVVRRLTTPGRVIRSTAYLTQTVASPTHSVTVLRTVPEVQTHVVTVAGRTHTTTVVRRTTAPGKTQTQTQTVSTTVPTTEVQTTTVTVTKRQPGTTKTVTTTTTVPTTVVETTTVHRTVTVTTTENGATGTVPGP
jgi:hypothetical protein